MGDTRSHYTLLNITTQHWPMAAVACYYMVSEIAVVYGASKARREVKRSGTALTRRPAFIFGTGSFRPRRSDRIRCAFPKDTTLVYQQDSPFRALLTYARMLDLIHRGFPIHAPKLNSKYPMGPPKYGASAFCRNGKFVLKFLKFTLESKYSVKTILTKNDLVRLSRHWMRRVRRVVRRRWRRRGGSRRTKCPDRKRNALRPCSALANDIRRRHHRHRLWIV